MPVQPEVGSAMSTGLKTFPQTKPVHGTQSKAMAEKGTLLYKQKHSPEGKKHNKKPPEFNCKSI